MNPPSGSTLKRVTLATLASIFHLSLFAMPSSHLIFFGTYTRNGSRGIYAARLDSATGVLSEPTLAVEANNAPWIVLSPDKKFLYTVSETESQAIGFAVDAANARLTPLPAAASPAARPPSHLAVDATGRTLLAANYAEGYVESMPIRADGTLGAPVKIQHTGTSVNPTRQTQSHAHSVTPSPDNRFVIVCDLGLDKIFTYALDPGAATLTPANPPFVVTAPGAGPRHFKFGADGRHAYAINEMGGTITAYDYDAVRGALTTRQTVPTLPADFKGETTCAEVRVHPSGKFLYGSNRGHDSIAVFAIDATTGLLTPVEIVPSGGKIPRNFAFSPDGAWLVCAHQDSNNVTVFRVDPATGRLTRTASTATVPASVCVLFYD
jgi:6-phosphogluconolactonase